MKNMSILVEFEVFAKMSSLSPLLVIPMLQIVIKHLKSSLFVCFLRGAPGLLLQSTAFQLYEYSYRILHESKPVKYDFKPMMMTTKSVHKTRDLSIKYIIVKYILARFTQT